MSGAKTASVKGPDPKTSDSADDGALKHGLTLGEWLNQAVLAHEEAASAAESGRFAAPELNLPSPEGGDDWALNGGAETRRMAEALTRLAERLETSERRQALVVTGLDRSVLGLAARVEDAEADVRKNAVTVTGAVEALRRTGDEITQRVAHVEAIAREAATEVLATIEEFTTVQSEIDGRFSSVEENARRSAETIAASALSEARASQIELERRVDEAEAASRAAAESAVAEIRTAQAALAQRMAAAEAEARAAALDAVRVLRDEQQDLADRVGAAEAGGQAAAQDAMRELQAAQAVMHARLQEIEVEARRATAEALQEVRRAHEELAERVAAAGADTRTASAVLDIESAQRTLADRLETIESIARDSAARATAEVAEGQRGIEQRLEQIEAATREAAANLRMGAAAAINQVRAAQLDLEKRVKLVEAGATFGASGDGEAVRQLHQQLDERLERIERDPGRGQDRAALHMLDAKITGLAAAVRDGREKTAQEIEALHSRNGLSDEFTTRIETLEQTVEGTIARLADRLATAEATANEAIRALEHAPGAHVETDAFRALVEQRLDGMANSMTEIRSEIAAQIATAGLVGSDNGPELDAALADVNRRVAAAERRQAHTIEAISIEIRRMSESVDRRLRSLETRNDDAAAVAVREEVERLSLSLDQRLTEIDHRELASAERFGAEMGRLAERFDERFDGVERRSAEAIEHVGEQVARMAERFTQRQDTMARELTERIVESEERQSSRLTDAISNLNSRLMEAEELSGSSISPVQKAMSSLAQRLQAVEDSVPGVKRSSYGEPKSPDISVVYALSAEPPVEVVFDTPITAANEADNRSEDFHIPDAPSVARNELDDFGVASLEDEASALDSFEETVTEIHTPEPTPQVAAEAPAEEDAALAWEQPESPAESQAVEAQAVEDLFEPEIETTAPQTRESYLTAARRAAQTSQAQGKRSRNGSEDAAPIAGLRGPNRVVVWGAAGAIAVALAGGAYFWTKRGDEARTDTRPAPEPETSPAAALPATPPVALDPAAPETGIAPDDITGAVDPGVASTSIADAAAKAKADAAARSTSKATTDRVSSARAVQGPQTSLEAQTRQIAATATTGPIAISLDQAALRGDAVAQYELGLQRLSGGQTPEGVSLLRRAANQGLAMAQYRLAKLFERGEGVPVDLAQARQWTERAAAAGNRKAMHDLGVFYARGEGAPLDEASAFRWFHQAAELGVADSQFNLGVLYQQGRGTVASPSEALYWFSIAARAGDNDARARMATLESQIATEQIAQIRTRVGGFRARPASARANGEFGQRVWSSDTANAPQPRRS
ncbi:MAG: localization factor PodJL [Alphaproteobacteria bacterium]|nr:MAG: localization factor PodJL [Alphaproteobacteria bacterium]